jgi:site-specific DNA-adenine methylase
MTSYHGGKYRHGEEIARVIKDVYDKQLPGSVIGYLEPFCGMCGVYRHVVNLLPKNLKYVASDQHDSLILMWKALQDNWIPATRHETLSNIMSLLDIFLLKQNTF